MWAIGEIDINNGELLKFALDNGMIDLSYVQEKIEMTKREELLKKHPYKIWKGNDGNWHTYFPDQIRGRVPKKRKTEKDLEDDIVEYWRTELENPTIKEVFEEWNDRRLELKKISKATHLRNSQIFNRHYKEFGMKRIKSIKSEEIGDFLENQIPQYELTAKAFSNLKSITKGFLKRAKKRKLIDFNIEEILYDLDTSESDFKKKIKEDYEEVFNEEETATIIEYLENNPDILNLGILLMFVTGIRVGELAALKHNCVGMNTINIRRTETRYLGDDGKYVCDVKEYPKSDAGVRTVIIPKRYVWIFSKINSLNLSGEFLFSQNGKRLHANCFRMRLSRLCAKLNIYHKSPHKIRKTYGTILLDNNIDQKIVIGQMGHSDILCTEKYYHRNRRTLEEKERVINEIPEFLFKMPV